MVNSSDKAAITLQITAGPQAGENVHLFDHQTLIIGRSQEAHLRLSSGRECSRFHCRMEVNPPELRIVDLGSRNGTRVNGQRVEAAFLKHGDVVSIGDTQFTVAVTAATPGIANDIYTPTQISPVASEKHNPESEEESSIAPTISELTIERELGHGGMGVVFLARKNRTGEKVAVKVMKQVVSNDKNVIERFRREASIVLRLNHKRIVRCMDFNFTHDDHPYIVMEYVDQVSIPEFLDTKDFHGRIRAATGIVVRLLEALHHAHSQDIVHRDVKPGNLLAFRSGQKLQVKLADFGLAKNYLDAGFSKITTSNEICGTLAYMAPEQISDSRYARPRCDIYAAGVCLYNLLSGRLPFEAHQAAQQIALILYNSATPITDYVEDLPVGLQRIVSRSLSREPEDRYATAEEMRSDLLRFTKRD